MEAKDYNDTSRSLDLHSFVKNQAAIRQLKADMLQQAQTQRDFYQKIIKGEPDLEEILHYGNVIAQYRSKTEKKMKVFLQTNPEYYLEPLLLFAHYQSRLNYSLKEFLQYQKYYRHRNIANMKSISSRKVSVQKTCTKMSTLLLLSLDREKTQEIFCSVVNQSRRSLEEKPTSTLELISQV